MNTRGNQPTARRLVGCLSLAIILAAPDVARGQSALVCSADPPIVAPGGALRLRTYAVNRDASRPAWTVSHGEVKEKGIQTEWIVPDAIVPGTRLTATANAAGQSSCSVSVLVVDPDLSRKPLAPSWFPLLPGQQLGKYGLYTYFVLRGPPTQSLRPAVLKALETYVGFAPFLELMRPHVDTSNINLTLLPALRLPKLIRSDLLLDEYNYAAATAIARHVPEMQRGGVYLVSSLTPLHERNGGAPIAVQELSAKPAAVVGLWVREFLAKTSAEQTWNPGTLRRLVLELRTILAVLSDALPGPPADVDKLIVLKSK